MEALKLVGITDAWLPFQVQGLLGVAKEHPHCKLFSLSNNNVFPGVHYYAGHAFQSSQSERLPWRRG